MLMHASLLSGLQAPCARRAASVTRKTRAVTVAAMRPHRVNVAATVEESVMSPINLWGDNRRIQTQVLDVADDTISIRSLDWDRDRFDIEFGLQNGTTYNSYLIMGEKTALVDASHEKFRGLYIDTLKEQLAAHGRQIDYIFCSHTEPDHSGLIPDVIDMFPEAIVVGSKVCLAFLENLTHRPFNKQQVKGGDKIDLGHGHEIEFVMAPNLHWPDTMFSYDHATGVIYTCDAFGMHYCSDDPYDVDYAGELRPHYRFYYDCLMKPNARSVLTALRKCKDLEIDTIAVGHGPILHDCVPDAVADYKGWSEAIGTAPVSVAVFYTSEYGDEKLAQMIGRGVTKTETAAEMVDLVSIDGAELRDILSRNNGVVIMAPPASSAEAHESLSVLFACLQPKKHRVMLAESFGGNDDPVDTLQTQLAEIGLQPFCAPLRVKEAPTDATYQLFEETATDLAQALSIKITLAKQKKAMTNDVAKAVARISTGLYVVTAARSDVKSAMIASWVAQASSDPPGLTIAVAKDRAIESLMQVGDEFVLNCLEEGKYSTTMKHFLKRFPPGADRFEGVEWTPATNGAPALADAIACLECKVVSRMDTPDHWVTYCEVVDGEIANEDAQTAVHRRKVGTYY